MTPTTPATTPGERRAIIGMLAMLPLVVHTEIAAGRLATVAAGAGVYLLLALWLLRHRRGLSFHARMLAALAWLVTVPLALATL